MVCPICGKKSEVGVFCSECYLKKNLVIRLPSLLEASRCPHCGRYLIGGKWVGMEEEEAVEKIVKRSLKINIQKIDKLASVVVEIRRERGDYIALVRVLFGNSEKNRRCVVRFKDTLCPRCSRMAGGYYEAVVQLRGDIGDEMLELISRWVGEDKDPMAFIGDIKTLHGGYDIYIGGKKVAERVVKRILRHGGGEVRSSPYHVGRSTKLIGVDRQKSKEKRRFYYVVRL